MKVYIYQKLNKKNIIFLAMLMGLMFLSLLPRYSYANAPRASAPSANPPSATNPPSANAPRANAPSATNTPSNLFLDPNRSFGYVQGNACGDKTCKPDEVCQKEYRGVLPIESNTNTATFTCVKARPIEAPDSPYKGVQAACGNGFQQAFGIDISSLTDNVLINTLAAGLGQIRSSLGLGEWATGFTSTGPQALNFNDVGKWFIDPTRLALTGPSYFKDFVQKCESAYNNIIKPGINTSFLVAPLPVDIFNPLPLPVNVTSPTPLPVVVVDDLALYQQKELIDAPLAAQQKAATIITITESVRDQISNNNLAPNNYFTLNQLATQFGALDKNTGILSQALNQYGNYANFSFTQHEELAQYFKDSQDSTKSLLPKENFSKKCGNTRVENANTFECMILGLLPNNNPNDIKALVFASANAKINQAHELLDAEVRDGRGIFSKTENNNKNPFIKIIQTPGSTISSMAEEITTATINQAIVASGDNCFEAMPTNILEGTITPILQEGLYRVDNTLNSVINTAVNAPIDAIRNRRSPDLVNQLQSTITGAIPNPEQILKSLQTALIRNITSSLSCQFNYQISTLLNGTLENISIPETELLRIPGIGGITIRPIPVGRNIQNAVTGAINNTVNRGIDSILR